MHMAISKTQHCVLRLQQRGIPPLVLDLLSQFGESQYHEGCEILSFTKKALRRIAQYAGADIVRQIQKYMACYAVFKDGACVTVAYQLRHHKRDRQ